MELLICAVIAAVLVFGFFFLWDALKANKEVRESAEAFLGETAAMRKAEADAPRILVLLQTANTIAGWAPCQFVTIPDGEYVAWVITRKFDVEHDEEEAVCFAQVEQTWNGQVMRRDVYVRVADYPNLRDFPTESSQLQILSANK